MGGDILHSEEAPAEKDKAGSTPYFGTLAHFSSSKLSQQNSNFLRFRNLTSKQFIT